MSSKVLAVFVAVLVLAVGAFLLLRNARSAPAPDGAVLSQLRQAGSNLDKPHNIEFFLYLPGEAAARRVAAKLEAQGFMVEVKPSASGNSDWLTLAKRAMVPRVDELLQLRAQLSALCETEGGEYDGWGTEVAQ
ncbi:ribonuclease E inhibitor RraB [Ideonella sp. BN130291]|uniref:ribonuclease E inhibitor RraB n=1 Tax=Ideonella sp. BN130291 TaxID=3112940 RepID=UPI002E2591B7|nr:ribonuclease E inhibitor RraB [Ideonella sp. BN130291]